MALILKHSSTCKKFMKLFESFYNLVSERKALSSSVGRYIVFIIVFLGEELAKSVSFLRVTEALFKLGF
jgi:hypothetical protein